MISILGMHRSGTSALAGALHKLGANLGPPSSWIQPAADNPRGFFEYLPVVNLNRDILAALGGTWSTPPPLPPGWVDDERLTGLRERAEWLSKEMPDTMVVKDPRLCLLQPLWDEVAAVQPGVLCLRHPCAVANSLLERNQFSVDQGLFLWFRYNAAAVLNRPAALLVEYESLLTDPAPQLERVADHIDGEVSAKMIQAAAATVQRSMAHHTGRELPDTPIGIMCRRLYDLIRSGGALRSDESVWIWARLATELPWAGPADRDLARVQSEITELNSQIDRLTEESRRRQGRIQRLETELRHALRAVDIVSVSETADLFRSQEANSDE